MILRVHVRPALERLKVEKKIGWHSFRHGLATLLRQQGVDIKTAQDLLRHANSRITLDVYQQAVSEEKRVAQSRAFVSLIGGIAIKPFRTQLGEEKGEVALGTA